jgi:NTE family protein
VRPRVGERRVDLVFEGGGVKGIGLVGALAVLEERGYEPQNLAGTSAGAIVAALSAAGYSAAELRDLVLGLDYRAFEDRAWEDEVPLAGIPLSLLKDRGVFEGEALLAWLRERLSAKGVETFRDLVHPEFAADERYRYRVQVIASDLTARRLLVLPQDARTLGIAPDDLEVALAVRMSAGIPFFFEPVRARHRRTGREHLVVDGGVLSNFPVWLFDTDGEPPWPTFGLLLVEPDPTTPLSERLPRPGRRDGGLVDYARSLIMTMLEAHDRLYVEKANFARTIPIGTLGVRTTDFGLSRRRALDLYGSGRRAAEEFLAGWDFEGYVARFRGGEEHSRRAEVAAEMRRA